jgi:hypothetical protein
MTKVYIWPDDDELPWYPWKSDDYIAIEIEDGEPPTYNEAISKCTS